MPRRRRSSSSSKGGVAPKGASEDTTTVAAAKQASEDTMTVATTKQSKVSSVDQLRKPELPWSPVLAGKAGSVPLVFTRDEEYFFVAVSSSIRIFSTSSGRLVSTLSSSPYASTSYADANVDTGAQAAQTKKPLKTSIAHTAAITGLLLNPANPAQLVSSSLDGTIKVWDYLDGRLIRTLHLGLPIKRMCSHAALMGRVVVAIKKPRVEQRSATDAKSKYDELRSNTVIHIVTLVGKKRQSDVTRPSKERVGKVRSLSDLAISSDGRFIVAVGKRKIHVEYLDSRKRKDGMKKIITEENITRVAFHPTNNTFATGHQNGQIRIWYFLSSGGNEDSGEESEAVQLRSLVSNKAQMAPSTLLHWHAHAVSALCFSDNGALLMSGGEESVLVLWQLTTQSREYVPRLGGATIVSISALQGVSETQKDQIVVAMEDGSVAFISPFNFKVVRTLAGILASSIAHSAAANAKLAPALRRRLLLPPLAVQPESQYLITSAGHTSTLQFLDAETDEQVMQQEIVPSNRVSRPDDDPLDQPQVEHVCFSAQRQWMATVDRMPSGETSLKIWSWVEKTLSYEVNTRVDLPHGGEDVCVLGMAFSPRSYASIDSPLLVTFGSDNKCRTWRCVRHEIKRKQETYWIARSAFDHRNQTPRAIAWSFDGSLLAVVHGSSAALWEPEGNTLLHVMPLATGHTSSDVESDSHAIFAGQGGRYLVVAVSNVLSVFDIVLGSLQYERNTASAITGLVPLLSDETDSSTDFAVVSSDVTSRTSDVSLFTLSTDDEPKSFDLPFGVRKAVGTTTEVQDRLSFFALTHDFDIVRVGSLGEDRRANADTTQALERMRTFRRRRTLFDELLGPAEHDVQPPVVAVPDATLTAKRNEDDVSKLFDMPSHLLPPPHLLLTPFLKMIMPKRREDAQEDTTAVRKTGEATDDDQGEDVPMAVDAPVATTDTLQSRMTRIAGFDLSSVTASFAALTTDANATLHSDVPLVNGDGKAATAPVETTNGTSSSPSPRKKKGGKDANVSGSEKTRRRSSSTAKSPTKANGDTTAESVTADGGRKRKMSGSDMTDA